MPGRHAGGGIAQSFGKFSLYKLLNKDVGQPPRPAEHLRLEIEIEALTGGTREAVGELLRSGVFVDGGFSSSSKGKPARRLIFRKLFTPVFPTTYRNRDTWPMTARHFEQFVQDPERYVKLVMGKDGVPPDEQQLQWETLIDPV